MTPTRQYSFRLDDDEIAQLDQLAELLTQDLARSMGRPTAYAYNRTMALRYAIGHALDHQHLKARQAR
jgi:hypothetical protein